MRLALFCLVLPLFAFGFDAESDVAKEALMSKVKKGCGVFCKERVRRFESTWANQGPPIETRTEEGRMVTWAQHPPGGLSYEVAVLVSPRGEATVRKAWIRFAAK